MYEPDDRLAGDTVWELFAQPTLRPAVPVAFRILRCLLGAGVLAMLWVVWVQSPPVAVALVCLAVTARDFNRGRQLARSIPDKAGSTICAPFAYGWGAFKFGITGFVLLVGIAFWFTSATAHERDEAVSALATSSLLGISGFFASAALTAMGLFAAYRAGMRVWVGGGVNQARTLFLAMLLVMFTFLVVVPMCIWMGGRIQPGTGNRDHLLPSLVLIGCACGGGVGIVLALDWISRRVIADRPGKFGPKVPTVGKWSA